MGYTYRFSVPDLPLSPCCGKTFQDALNQHLETARKKREALLRAVAAPEIIFVNQKVLFKSDEVYSRERYLALRRIIAKCGFGCDEPYIPHWVQGSIGLGLGAAMMVLCLFSAGLPAVVMLTVGIISSLVTLAFGIPIFQKAWRALKEKTFTMDSLFTVSTLLAIVVSIVGLFVPGLPMLFEVGLFIFGFRHIGLAIEEAFTNHIDKEDSFNKHLPKTVQRRGEDVALEMIQPGDEVTLLPGMLIPFDGEVLSERASGVATWITGDREIRSLSLNTPLLAGVRLTEQSMPLVLRVQRNLEESHVMKMQAAMEAALMEERPSPLQKKMSKWLKFFVPLVFGVALCAGLILGLLFGPGVALSAVIGVIAAACPCVLGFIRSLVMKVFMEKGLQHGVTFTSANALEQAADIDTVVFDLNGTLTAGAITKVTFEWQPQVLVQRGILHAIESAAIAQKIEMSQAIATAILEVCESDHAIATTVESVHGGLKAEIDGQIWYCGNRKLMEAVGVLVPPVHASIEEQVLFLACGTALHAVMQLHRPLRPEARETIQQLVAQGKNIYICTGSDSKTAEQYAKQLKIDATCVRAECKPSDKKDFVESLTTNHARVAAVGDGGNDGLMLSAAHLAVVMTSTSDPAIEQHAAVVRIPGASLKPLKFLFPTADRNLNLIYLCLILSGVYNVVSVLLASGAFIGLGFVLMPAIAAAMMVLQAVLVLVVIYIGHRLSIPQETTPPDALPESTSSTCMSALGGEEAANEPNPALALYAQQSFQGGVEQHQVPSLRGAIATTQSSGLSGGA